MDELDLFSVGSIPPCDSTLSPALQLLDTWKSCIITRSSSSTAPLIEWNTTNGIVLSGYPHQISVEDLVNDFPSYESLLEGIHFAIKGSTDKSPAPFSHCVFHLSSTSVPSLWREIVQRHYLREIETISECLQDEIDMISTRVKIELFNLMRDLQKKVTICVKIRYPDVLPYTLPNLNQKESRLHHFHHQNATNSFVVTIIPTRKKEEGLANGPPVVIEEDKKRFSSIALIAALLQSSTSKTPEELPPGYSNIPTEQFKHIFSPRTHFLNAPDWNPIDLYFVSEAFQKIFRWNNMTLFEGYKLFYILRNWESMKNSVKVFEYEKDVTVVVKRNISIHFLPNSLGYLLRELRSYYPEESAILKAANEFFACIVKRITDELRSKKRIHILLIHDVLIYPERARSGLDKVDFILRHTDFELTTARDKSSLEFELEVLAWKRFLFKFVTLSDFSTYFFPKLIDGRTVDWVYDFTFLSYVLLPVLNSLFCPSPPTISKKRRLRHVNGLTPAGKRIESLSSGSKNHFQLVEVGKYIFSYSPFAEKLKDFLGILIYGCPAGIESFQFLFSNVCKLFLFTERGFCGKRTNLFYVTLFRSMITNWKMNVQQVQLYFPECFHAFLANKVRSLEDQKTVISILFGNVLLLEKHFQSSAARQEEKDEVIHRIIALPYYPDSKAHRRYSLDEPQLSRHTQQLSRALQALKSFFPAPFDEFFLKLSEFYSPLATVAESFTIPKCHYYDIQEAILILFILRLDHAQPVMIHNIENLQQEKCQIVVDLMKIMIARKWMNKNAILYNLILDFLPDLDQGIRTVNQPIYLKYFDLYFDDNELTIRDNLQNHHMREYYHWNEPKMKR